MYKLSLLLLFAMPLICLGADLDCPQSEFMDEISDIYYPGRTLIHELSACKSNPNVNDQKIFVLAYKNKDSTSDESFFDVDILIHDSISKKNVAHFYREKIWGSDAYKIDRVDIDTANYAINKTTRAFGINEHWGSSSSYSRYEVHTLSLFIVNGGTVEPVLDGLKTYIYQGEGLYKKMTRLIIIGDDAGQKYRNLKINEKSCWVLENSASDECDSKTVKQRHYIFKSNASGYIFPDGWHDGGII